MKSIKVNLGERNYSIEIGKGIIAKINFNKFGNSKYAIITDSNVKNLYGKFLLDLLRGQGLDADIISFPAGEKSKTPERAIEIGRELAKRKFDRNSMIVALGGGVVGDLAGYIASFYERGIDFIQIPTTLLAQVDSSIGGKTGVDIPEGKNMFGSFYQPKAVFTDINFLETLSEEEVRNGMAEIIKYGVIGDSKLFKYLGEGFSKRDDKFYLNIVENSCKIKAKIVEQDERESELRKILNYGHTIGHAIEVANNYKMSHGEAIALGMVYEGKLAKKLGLLDSGELEAQNKLIKLVGLPVNYQGDINGLIEIMRRDKKNKDGKIYFVLPKKIGKVEKKDNKIAFPVEESIISECLRN